MKPREAFDATNGRCAALRSRSITWPQSLHLKIRSPRVKVPFILPHLQHRLDEGNQRPAAKSLKKLQPAPISRGDLCRIVRNDHMIHNPGGSPVVIHHGGDLPAHPVPEFAVAVGVE